MEVRGSEPNTSRGKASESTNSIAHTNGRDTVTGITSDLEQKLKQKHYPRYCQWLTSITQESLPQSYRVPAFEGVFQVLHFFRRQLTIGTHFTRISRRDWICRFHQRDWAISFPAVDSVHNSWFSAQIICVFHICSILFLNLRLSIGTLLWVWLKPVRINVLNIYFSDANT